MVVSLAGTERNATPPSVGAATDGKQAQQHRHLHHQGWVMASPALCGRFCGDYR
jgi:hypothetical protein